MSIRYCKVWTSDGRCREGEVRFPRRGLEIVLKSGQRISMIDEDVYYEESVSVVPSKKGKRKEQILENPIKIKFKPLVMRMKPYSEQSSEPEDIFPESTYTWLSRMKGGKNQALYIVQEIVDDNRFWLSIADPVTGQLFEKHFCQYYEVWSLALDSVEVHRNDWLQAIGPDDPDAIAFSFMRALEEELSWSEIHTLAGDMGIDREFQRSQHAWGTLEDLVPSSINGASRNELKAFLAWVSKDRESIDEPIELLNSLSGIPFFKSLVEVHIRYAMEGTGFPAYLSIIESTMKEPLAERVRSETLHESTISRVIHSIMKDAPDWRSFVIRYIESLSQSKRISLKFPISKEEAQKSNTSKLERFALFSLGLHIRAHVRAPAFGLRRVVYLGNAYRWPHPMLSWSANLPSLEKYPTRFQVMLMPPSAVEQAKRCIPKLVELEWSARASNPSLFIHSKKEWSSSVKKILRSLNRERSYQDIQREFGRWKRKSPYQLSQTEARTLDTAVARLYLSNLESPKGRRYWGVKEEEAVEFLSSMNRIKGIQVFYEFNETGLPRPLFVSVQGQQDRVCSFTRSLLSNSPSSVAYFANGGSKAFIISSLPMKSRNTLLRELPERGREANLEIKCTLPTSYQNYTSDLFQRLLKSDGSWTDNLSGLLTQARSVPSTLLNKDSMIAEEIQSQKSPKVMVRA